MKLLLLCLLIIPSYFIYPVENHDSLEKLLPTQNGKDKLIILAKLAESGFKIKPAKAIEYCNDAIELLKNNNDSKVEISIYNTRGLAYYFLGDVKEGLANCTKSKTLAEKYNDQEGLGTALNSLGKIYLNSGDYQKSLEYQKRSLEIRQKLGNKEHIATTLFALGNVYLYTCDYKKSLEYYYKSMKYFDEVNDKLGVSDALVNSGIINSKLGYNDEAIKNYLQAVKILERINEKKSLSSAYVNIGIVYKDIARYDSSLIYFFKGLELKKEVGHKKGEAVVYHNMGEVYRELKQYSLALHNYEMSLKIKKELDDKRGIARTLINRGMVFKDLGENQRAIKELNTAEKMANEISGLDLLDEIYQQLYELYKSQNSHKQALVYHEYLWQVRDSIKNENISNTIKELEVRYETEQKEKEIVTLRNINLLKEANIKSKALQRNLLIIGLILTVIVIFLIYYQYRFKNRMNIKLKAEAEELAGKLVETQLNVFKTQLHPHFLFNTLNNISVLVRKAENSSAARMITSLSEFLRYTLYNFNNQFSTLEKEIAILKHYINILQMRYGDRLSVNFIIPEDLLRAKIPVLILQPLVENSVKHGISKLNSGGIIVVKAEKAGDNIKILINDNGPGLPDRWDNLKKGIGTTNTVERLVRLYGEHFEFTLKNDLCGGTLTVILLPLEITEGGDNEND